MVDIDDLVIQFYAVSAILAFLIIVLLAVVIHLSVTVRSIKKRLKEEEVESPGFLSVPPGNFTLPKPKVSPNLRKEEDEIRPRWQEFRGENSPQSPLTSTEYALPIKKFPSLRRQESENTSGWQEFSREPQKRNYDQNYRNDEFTDRINHNNDRNFEKLPSPRFTLPSSENNFSQNNFGFRRDNYY